MENSATAELIARDVPCIRCGYNLRGLSVAGRCPECGEERALSNVDRRMAAADRGWRQRLRLGAALHGAALVVFTCIISLLILGLWSANPIWHYAGLTLAIILGAAGTWLATTREPGGPYYDDARWLQRTLRALAVLSSCGMSGYLAIQIVEHTLGSSFVGIQFWQDIAGYPAFGGGLLVNGLLMWHLARLARRFDGGRMGLLGRLAAFTTPAVVVAMICFSVILHKFYPGVGGWPFQAANLIFFDSMFLVPAAYAMAWAAL